MITSNDIAHLPRRPGELHATECLHAAAVRCSAWFGDLREQPLDCLRRVSLEPAGLEVNRLNDEPPHPDERTKPARPQDRCRAGPDGLPGAGHRSGIGVRRIHAGDLDSHLTGSDLNIGLEDRNVVATAGCLADLTDAEFQSVPPRRRTLGYSFSGK